MRNYHTRRFNPLNCPDTLCLRKTCRERPKDSQTARGFPVMEHRWTTFVGESKEPGFWVEPNPIFQLTWGLIWEVTIACLSNNRFRIVFWIRERWVRPCWIVGFIIKNNENVLEPHIIHIRYKKVQMLL